MRKIKKPFVCKKAKWQDPLAVRAKVAALPGEEAVLGAARAKSRAPSAQAASAGPKPRKTLARGTSFWQNIETSTRTSPTRRHWRRRKFHSANGRKTMDTMMWRRKNEVGVRSFYWNFPNKQHFLYKSSTYPNTKNSSASWFVPPDGRWNVNTVCGGCVVEIIGNVTFWTCSCCAKKGSEVESKSIVNASAVGVTHSLCTKMRTCVAVGGT